MAKVILVVSILALLTGCVSTVSETELRESARSTQGDTIGMVYYKGRKSGYDQRFRKAGS